MKDLNNQLNYQKNMIYIDKTIVDVNFTANLEALLDGVEEGTVGWKTIVENFYPDLNEAVLAAEKEVEEALGADGRILVRASGTEPLLRVMVEAESQELCKKYVKKVIDAMKSVM